MRPGRVLDPVRQKLRPYRGGDPGGSCADGYFSEKKPRSIADKFQYISPHADVSDPEKGLAVKEHFILSVSDMTSTGYGTKLQLRRDSSRVQETRAG